MDVLSIFRRKRRPLSTSEVADALGVSRQAAHRKLRALGDEGKLAVRGAGRSSRWELAAEARAFRFPTRGLAEDRVWAVVERDVPWVSALGEEARRIAGYAFTEMLNNAIEHSGSKTVEVRVMPAPKGCAFEIVDRGRGAFETVRAKLGLGTTLEALQELSKGKVTTMPERHSGEGIFFTSKVVRRFEMDANGHRWIVDNARGDYTVTKGRQARGTDVRFEVARTPSRTLASVFDEYTIDHEFSRTRAVVRLFALGTEFVSRSEARRILANLDRFREVVFDFTGVPSIGQAFADEVFRVWTTAHPSIVVTFERASEEVAFMIAHAKP